ncbi:MAG: glycoside hydrolase family 36 protein [Bacteroidota bacterium]
MIKVFNTSQDTIQITQNTNLAESKLYPLIKQEDLSLFRFELSHKKEFVPKPIVLEWKFPAVGVIGVWKPTADFSKRIEADWELETHESRISIDAPVLALFRADDENALCFSCSNAINSIEMSAKYREEDNIFYCQIILFTECKYPIKDFSLDIRLDFRKIPFHEALRQTSTWWETFEHLIPVSVPAIAKLPLYSTWYQFHQNLEEALLLQECQLAKQMGFESIIIDDGWQTKDNNRGYDYTGDWYPEHFDNFGALVKKIQNIGIKVGLWFSVPFCGIKSKAYKRFKGKFLTENHRWAPVFDPRYPEVREYLVTTYVNAVKNWHLDGLKLDFIDDFKSYPETDFENDGKDILSINGAVDLLLTQVRSELEKVKPEIFIEFRQKYTGPAMRKYGNMLRAFDCPGDYTMNRVRIADIKMLAGNTAVHADMVKWNFDESVEAAALHYINTLFGVPQISVMLTQAPPEQLKMISFYTQYWRNNSEILLSGNYTPKLPLENYPIQYAMGSNKTIVGLHSDQIVFLSASHDAIDVINAKTSDKILLDTPKDQGSFDYTICNCQGVIIENNTVRLNSGCNRFHVPSGGLLRLKRIHQQDPGNA